MQVPDAVNHVNLDYQVAAFDGFPGGWGHLETGEVPVGRSAEEMEEVLGSRTCGEWLTWRRRRANQEDGTAW